MKGGERRSKKENRAAKKQVHVLQTKCLYPPQIPGLNPNPQCDVIWRWRLWEGA